MASIAQQAKDLREKLGSQGYELFLKQTSKELCGADYLDMTADRSLFTEDVLNALDLRIIALHSEHFQPVLPNGPLENS